jgi:hypothetical protein
MDFTEVPVSFQIALGNKFEIFYQTDVYRGVKVNSLRNISGTYLPNSGYNFPAIVLAPNGTLTNPNAGNAIYRPAGSFSQVAFPFFGGNPGSFGLPSPALPGQFFGFCAANVQCPAVIGTPFAGGTNGSIFPGVGSAVGGILPGLVLNVVPITLVTGAPGGTAPNVFTIEPSYNPDAPLINKRYGDSFFNTHTGGFKWRWTSNDNPVGVGIVGAYRWFHDRAPNRIDELFDGASPGGNRGDILGTFFVDARVGKHVNVSANVGYHLNSSITSEINGFKATLLDRPDELLLSAGVDFPVNQWFQPIAEVRYIRYVRSRTENAFENNPWEVLGGFRIFPKRWYGFSFAYRRHMNQQDEGQMDGTTFSGRAVVLCRPVSTAPAGLPSCTSAQVTNSFTGVPPGFQLSENPHGWIFQFFVGRRNPRLVDVENKFANVTGLTISDTTITLPCAPGTVPVAGSCNDATTVTVATTAVDPENDVLTYNYTVSGGRIVGTGANVSWDLSGLQPGTYTITAGVDDGCGLCGQTQTRTVTIEACNCKPACDCGTLSVSGPAGVTNPGDTMTFTATVSGGSASPTYNWSVSAGTIESGQGTPSIVVRTARENAGQTITATVDLGGLDPNCNCQRSASESGPVAPNPQAELVDQFGALPNDDIRGRLDAFFQVLSNNPNDQGYIINYGTDREVAAREKLITNHITFRKFDRARITLVRGGDKGTGAETKLYRIPPGATNPNP